MTYKKLANKGHTEHWSSRDFSGTGSASRTAARRLRDRLAKKKEARLALREALRQT